MGVSGKWVKALVSLRKPEGIDRHDKMGYQCKKWTLFRKSFGELGFRRKGLKINHGTASGRCDSADIPPLATAVATLARDPPPNLWVVRQEWAATRIQTAFRAFLARWALKALKGVVRIQALVRGRQVRKQAAAALRCMQALVRVQARIRASHVRRSSEGQAVQHVLDQHRKNTDCLRQAEEGWSWLEQCAAAKRRVPSAHKLDPELRSVSVRKNNFTTRISAKLPKIGKFSSSSSSPSSEVFSGGSRLTTPAAVKIEGKSRDRPNYMNSTKSSEGKLKSSTHLSRKGRGWSVDDLQFSGF